jgi:DNA-binding MarR family transcriptional regulator
MARKVHRVDHERNPEGAPLVGALLRRPFMAARAQIVRDLHAAGFVDLTAAHLAVFQYPGPHGRSPGELARAAGASKQAMNNLLAQLERAGYLVRTVNPDNRRERTLELTARGHTVVTTIRTAVTGIERRWRADLGDRDYQQLRALLERLDVVVGAD